jgi:hypothetical protein
MNLSFPFLRVDLLRAAAQAAPCRFIKLSPVLSSVHGTFSSGELGAEPARRSSANFEIHMVHTSQESQLPRYTGTLPSSSASCLTFAGPSKMDYRKLT